MKFHIFHFLLVSMVSLLGSSPTWADDFNYPAPATTGSTLNLYATRYYVDSIASATGINAVPLLRRDGSPIGISIKKSDFCFGALQGTLAVRTGTITTIYNADGLTSHRSATCTYRTLKPTANNGLGLQAWKEVTGNGTFGLGVHPFRLVPFRTIAVDPKVIVIGTVLYIPSLKGFHFDDNGVPRIHDGYVIACDVGEGITGNHIDFFTGSYIGDPPGFVTSKPTGLFSAMIVTNQKIINGLILESTYTP